MRRGTWKLSFPPNHRGAVVEYCRKYTVGHGVGRGSRPGYHPWSCKDRAGDLPAPAGGVVVAVGCTVLQMWRGGAPWTLQVRVLHIYTCIGGSRARGGPGPPWTECWRVHLRRSGSHMEIPDPSRGEGQASGC